MRKRILTLVTLLTVATLGLMACSSPNVYNDLIYKDLNAATLYASGMSYQAMAAAIEEVGMSDIADFVLSSKGSLLSTFIATTKLSLKYLPAS